MLLGFRSCAVQYLGDDRWKATDTDHPDGVEFTSTFGEDPVHAQPDRLEAFEAEALAALAAAN